MDLHISDRDFAPCSRSRGVDRFTWPLPRWPTVSGAMRIGIPSAARCPIGRGITLWRSGTATTWWAVRTAIAGAVTPGSGDRVEFGPVDANDSLPGLGGTQRRTQGFDYGVVRDVLMVGQPSSNHVVFDASPFMDGFE